MKKLLCTLLALSLLLCALPALAEGNDLLSQIQARGELIIGTEGKWAPWTFHNEEDELVGFDVEVGRAIAKKLGVKATFAESEWDAIFAGINAKRSDTGINCVEALPERADTYDFSIPYCYIRTALIVRGDRDDINSFEDLAGRSTANSMGSSYMLMAESYGANVSNVDTLEETLSMVLSGRVEATLNADVSFYDYMNVHPDANLKVVALTEDATDVIIPVRKGEENATFLAALNEAIEALREEGVLSELSMKYFGEDITTPDAAVEEAAQ